MAVAGRKLSATVWRKKVAHGASREEKCAITKSPSGATELWPKRFSFRRFAAPIANTATHG